MNKTRITLRWVAAGVAGAALVLGSMSAPAQAKDHGSNGDRIIGAQTDRIIGANTDRIIGSVAPTRIIGVSPLRDTGWNEV